MTERTNRWLLWSLVLVGFTLDQASKYGIFHWLYNNGFGDEYILIPGVFKLLAQFTGEVETGSGLLARLRTVGGEALPKVNHGALFGLGGEYVYLANTFFACISILAAIAITIWSTRTSAARDRLLSISLGLILAGTLGNLYDRLVFQGVRDFLYFYLINFPVFNVADCCLVCGAFLLLAQAIFRPAVDQPAESAAV